MEEQYTIQPVNETKTVIFDTTIDLGTDISEICIDMLQEESIIKEIPVLGTVYKVGKIGYSISRLTYIKKVLVFAQEMQRNDVDKSVLEKHRELMKQSPKKYYQELELIVEYLNRQVGYQKSVLNARAYYLYLEGSIEYDDLELLWEIIDQFYLNDTETLKTIYEIEVLEDGTPYDAIACKRLSSCGLMDYFNGMPAQDYEKARTIYARITSVGKFFCENILRM